MIYRYAVILVSIITFLASPLAVDAATLSKQVVLSGVCDTSYSAPTVYNIPGGAGVALFNDINEDGIADMITATANSQMLWSQGLGNGNFSTTFQNITGPGYVVLSGYYLAQLDGHGPEEIVNYYRSPTGFDGKIVVSRRDKAHNTWEHYTLMTGLTGMMYFDFADIEGDGDLDIFSAGSDKIAWFENQGSGDVFITHLIPTSYRLYQGIAAADMDADGDVDFYVGNINTNAHLAYFENINGSEFAPEVVIDNSYNTLLLKTVDLDNDGDLDLLASHGLNSSERLDWYANDGLGHLSPPNLIVYGSYPFRPYTNVLMDMDWDSDLDIVFEEFYPQRVGYIENLGGSFGPKTTLFTTSRPSALGAFDLNNDGMEDLAVVSNLDQKIRVSLSSIHVPSAQSFTINWDDASNDPNAYIDIELYDSCPISVYDYEITSLPTMGAVSPLSGSTSASVRFSANGYWSGLSQFTYVLTDAQGTQVGSPGVVSVWHARIKPE